MSSNVRGVSAHGKTTSKVPQIYPFHVTGFDQSTSRITDTIMGEW